MENRLIKVRHQVDRLIREKQSEKGHYLFPHLYGVSHFCTMLAIRRNLNVEIATICGMLHDIWQVTAGSSENHAVKGAKEAENLLKALDLFSNDELSMITTAISRHSEKHIIHDPMDEVLKDADVMHHCLYDASIPAYESEIERYTKILIELGCASIAFQ